MASSSSTPRYCVLQREQLVEIERREAGALDAAEVAAAALDPEHKLLLAVDGVDGFELRAGVAAAEVGQAEVGAEQVRAVAEKFRARRALSQTNRPTCLLES